jgi:hypothetical protein
VGGRSLAQLLLGLLAFVLFIEFWTAFSNDVVHIGGTVVRAPLLFSLLIVDVAALLVVSVSGRDGQG